MFSKIEVFEKKKKFLCCLFLDLQILIKPLVSSNCSCVEVFTFSLVFECKIWFTQQTDVFRANMHKCILATQIYVPICGGAALSLSSVYHVCEVRVAQFLFDIKVL